MRAKKMLLNRMVTLLTLTVTCALFIANPIQANWSADRFSQKTSFDEIDAYIEKQMDALNLPGAALPLLKGIRSCT